jgi:hypothetical protein
MPARRLRRRQHPDRRIQDCSSTSHGGFPRRRQVQEVTVTSGNQVVGRLPFVITRKMGLTALRMPPFTHMLGPVVEEGGGKPQTQLLRRLSIVRDLIDPCMPRQQMDWPFRTAVS